MAYQQARELTRHEATLEIPAAKLAAILAILNEVLLTTGDEAQRILNQIRGRRSALPLTFGELRNMVASQTDPLVADGGKIASHAIAAGVTDLGEAPTDLARVLILITPDLEPCDKCGNFPVSTLGGQVSMLFEGRCPHNECSGLITAVEQGKEFDSWTFPVVKMVPWAQTHDRASDAARHWPIRHDAVMRECCLADNLKSAMEREGLIVLDGKFKGQPDVVKFLIFANRGMRSCGNSGLADVFASLSDPVLIAGCGYDFTALRQICREAKEWKPQAQPVRLSVQSVSRASEGSSNEAIERLLSKMFSVLEMRRLVRYQTNGDDLEKELPGEGTSPAALASAVADLLMRNGLVTHAFFDSLNNARPRRVAEIEIVRDQVLGR